MRNKLAFMNQRLLHEKDPVGNPKTEKRKKPLK